MSTIQKPSRICDVHQLLTHRGMMTSLIEKLVRFLMKWFLQLYQRVVPHQSEKPKNTGPIIPTSVNYHFTRQCNYKCAFCFHTAKTSFVLPLEEAKRGLTLLRQAGMEKINFSGGEPFIHQKGRYLGQLVHFCKSQLGMSSVSVVSNGSLITENWFALYGSL